MTQIPKKLTILFAIFSVISCAPRVKPLPCAVLHRPAPLDKTVFISITPDKTDTDVGGKILIMEYQATKNSIEAVCGK